MKNNFIPSLNFHLWEPCNMCCKFCFARFQDVKNSVLPAGHLPKEQAVAIVKQAAAAGFEKITFAGGEPLLCPWLPELILVAKQSGLTTMIVTNGSLLTHEFLEQVRPYLDWVAISIDSLDPKTNIAMGRAKAGKHPLTESFYRDTVALIKEMGFGLKINTVVTRFNLDENMSEFIRFAQPQRWKIMQVLPISGQNDEHIQNLEISETEFNSFVCGNTISESNIRTVAESNSQMKGSYVMIDPAGRFFSNETGKHVYSRPILEVGMGEAIKDVKYDFAKFIDRGGIYNWQRNTQAIPKRICLSGEVASGKTSVGRLLAEKLGYCFVSIGNKTREKAASLGMSILEFQQYCILHPEMDMEIDKDFSDDCNACEYIVIDYRLGFKFIRDSFNIYLKISEDIATERLKTAGRMDETHLTVSDRNAAFRQQFKQAYQVDYTDESNYDLVIEINTNLSPKEIVEMILKAFSPIFPMTSG